MATLAQLRTRARQRADMELAAGQSEADHFITDSMLNQWINSAISELYDLITDGNLDIYTTSNTFNTTAGTLAYNVSDAYLIRHLEKQESSDRYSDVEKYNFKERNKRGLRYRYVKGQILFNQDPGTATYRYWHIPSLTALSGDSDTFSPYNDWEEFVETRVAIKCRQKEESDTSDLRSDLSTIAQRITGKVAQDDSGEPDSITDSRRGYITDDLGWEWDDY